MYLCWNQLKIVRKTLRVASGIYRNYFHYGPIYHQAPAWMHIQLEHFLGGRVVLIMTFLQDFNL